jgi:hypothetical protein
MTAPMSPKQFLMFMRRGFAPFEKDVLAIVNMQLVEGKHPDDKCAHITFGLPENPRFQYIHHARVPDFGVGAEENAILFRRTAYRIRNMIEKRAGRDATFKRWMEDKPI